MPRQFRSICVARNSAERFRPIVVGRISRVQSSRDFGFFPSRTCPTVRGRSFKHEFVAVRGAVYSGHALRQITSIFVLSTSFGARPSSVNPLPARGEGGARQNHPYNKIPARGDLRTTRRVITGNYLRPRVRRTNSLRNIPPERVCTRRRDNAPNMVRTNAPATTSIFGRRSGRRVHRFRPSRRLVRDFFVSYP